MMNLFLRHGTYPILMLSLACAGPKLYYLRTELLILEGEPGLAVAPGPWKHETIPAVVSDTSSIPDDLVVPTLKALMDLPGASDACDPNTGYPRPDATEYCVAIYRTPQDWRVSWPIRGLTGEQSLCKPPFGGVEDEDFGRNLPVLGFAHNHPCGTIMSSPDLTIFPLVKSGEGVWMMVAYGATPNGKLLRDSRGQLIPAWHWLATGRRDAPRFYRWNSTGEVFKWNEDMKSWEFQATCQPQPSSILSPGAAPPQCFPELK